MKYYTVHIVNETKDYFIPVSFDDDVMVTRNDIINATLKNKKELDYVTDVEIITEEEYLDLSQNLNLTKGNKIINWNDVEESVPTQEKYYLVKLVNNQVYKALYKKNKWRKDYAAKLVDKVLYWADIDVDIEFKSPECDIIENGKYYVVSLKKYDWDIAQYNENNYSWYVNNPRAKLTDKVLNFVELD
jgi:hypothetical protein